MFPIDTYGDSLLFICCCLCLCLFPLLRGGGVLCRTTILCAISLNVTSYIIPDYCYLSEVCPTCKPQALGAPVCHRCMAILVSGCLVLGVIFCGSVLCFFCGAPSRCHLRQSNCHPPVGPSAPARGSQSSHSVENNNFADSPKNK